MFAVLRIWCALGRPFVPVVYFVKIHHDLEKDSFLRECLRIRRKARRVSHSLDVKIISLIPEDILSLSPLMQREGIRHAAISKKGTPINRSTPFV